MHLLRMLPWIAVIMSSSLSLAQPPEQADREPVLVTRVYRVFDLVVPRPNYPFQTLYVPGARASTGLQRPMMEGAPAGGAGMGGEGGGMGGMPGGMGMGGFGSTSGAGGFFDVAGSPSNLWQQQNEPRNLRSAPRIEPFGYRITVDELVDTITATIAPDTWDDVGGEGSIQYLGGLLVVRQTNEVQQQINDLLNAFRSEGSGTTTVTIDVRWIVLPAGETVGRIEQDGRTTRFVERAWLQEYQGAAGAHGQITCMDGQTVHMIAGNFRSGIVSVTPVVGQAEPVPVPAAASVAAAKATASGGLSGAELPGGSPVLAQVGGDPGMMPGAAAPPRVGYQPQVQVINLGALLQVTPAVIPDTNEIILDLRSIVTRHPAGQESGVDFLSVARLERMNLVGHQFMTTLRMPLGRPVLVAGSTLQPLDAAADPEELYLVVEVTADRGTAGR